MKTKHLFFAMLAVTALSSCRKSYVCKCTTVSSSSSSGTVSASVNYESKEKKKDSQTWCKNHESSQTSNAGGYYVTYTTTCELQ